MVIKNHDGYAFVYGRQVLEDSRIEGPLDRLLAVAAAHLGYRPAEYWKMDDPAVAEMLGVSISELEAAVDRLVQLGYFVRTGYATREGGIRIRYQIPRTDGPGNEADEA